MLTVTRTYDATLDEVWDALTTAERIPRWLAPISGDLTLGGRFQIEGNAAGEIRTCVPPEHLSVTWEYGGDTSWVDASLRNVAGGTLLTLEHTAPVSPEMWAEFGPGAVGIGWEMMLMGLAEHLAAPDAARPDPADPDLVGPLREYMTASSDLWREASVAAGTEPAEARAAAERCLAAYTASPE